MPSSSVSAAFAAFALITICLLGGHAFARFRVVPRDAADTMNRFVIYVSLPAMVLRVVPALSWDPALAVLVVTPWIATAVGAAVVVAAARAFRFRSEVLAVLLLCAPLGNTSFLGFPMVGALLGPDAIRFAVLYDQFGSFLLLATYGLFVVARFSGGARPGVRAIVLRVIRFPPFIALVVALLPLPHPPVVDAVLEPLAKTLVPLALFAVGLKLELRLPRDRGALALGLVAKMALLPLVALGVTRAFGSPKGPAAVAILEAAMPPMITAGVLAVMADLAPELATDLVTYGIVVSFASLPLIAMLVR